MVDLGSKIIRSTDQTISFHPFVYWSIYGQSSFVLIKPICRGVFSTYGTSPGSEWSFKARSNVHNKRRNCLGSEMADKQSFSCFNCKQLRREEQYIIVSRKYTLGLSMIFGIELIYYEKLVSSVIGLK